MSLSQLKHRIMELEAAVEKLLGFAEHTSYQANPPGHTTGASVGGSCQAPVHHHNYRHPSEDDAYFHFQKWPL